MELNIFNQQEEKVAILSTAQTGSHVAIYDANIEEKLDSYDILTFTIDADTEESTHAVEGNTIVFKDIKGWREYYITNVEEVDGDVIQKTITAELSLIELADEVIETDLSGSTTNPKVALESLLVGTRFEVGIVDESIYNKRFNTDTFYLNVLEAISELASEYSAEVQVSYQIKDGKIEKRLINLYKQFGRNNGKRFEIEKDITSIKRTVDISQLKTAIIPFTDEKSSQDAEGNESSGSRITINDVVWSKAKGDPTDKPLGQNYLEDKTALANFGRIGKDGKLKHKKLSMEINVDSAEALISMAWVQLARYSTPKVTYEVKAVDLYALTKDEDFKHEEIFLGDTIIAVDKNFAVPIVIETRVVEVKRDLLDATNNEYVFGTSKELFSYQEQLDSIEEKIKDVVINIDNIQQNADGFTTTYRGSTQPATARENDLWYRPHPTIVGERQMLIFNGTTWEIASDTSVKGLVDKDILEVQKDTQDAIKKAQDAVDLAEGVEDALVFKVGTEEYNSQMTALENNINLRVEKDDVIHQINISDEQILIAGDKIIISGDTTVDGTFKVTNEMIASGVSADKITVGTINGKTVNVINLNADNITGGNLDMQNITMKNGEQTILSINQDGEVVLNVSHMKIGMFDAVTTEDLKKLESQYTFILTNDSVTVPTDKDGNNGDYSLATTQPIMYKLGVLDNSWTITASATVGVVGAFSGGKYTVTNMTSKSGSVTFTAKKDSMTLTKVFNITKALAGSKGDKGDTGSSGKDGIAGKDGVGIKTTTITYSQSTSGTTAPTSGWSTSVPTLVKGQYLWTKTTWTYTDNSTEIGYTVSYNAKDGNDGTDGIAGKDGVGISNTTIQYVGSTSGTTRPSSGWSTTIPTVAEGSYLWTKTTWTYTDGTKEEGFSVAKMGAKGATGSAGVSSYTWIRYSPNANGSAMTTTPASNSLYIGVVTTTTNSAPTDYTVYTWALIKGSDGKGVKSTAVTYQSGASGTTTPTGTWTTTIPSVTKGQYLWTRVITTYTDNSTSTSYSASYQGVDGVTNVTGLLTNESITLPANVGGTVTNYTGATGTFDVFEGLTKKTGTEVKYSVLSKTNIEITIATTGVYTITSMTSGLSTLNGFAILRAIYNGVTIDKQINVAKAVTGATGATGASGKDGVAGKDGKGINSTVITYMTSTSGTTAPTTGWTSTVPTLTKGQYLWTRTIWTYTDSTTETGYSVSYIAKDGNTGKDGIAGKDGVGIKSTAITYAGSTSGTATPTSGWTTAVPTVAQGSFLWTRTIWTYTDNTTETGYSVARMGVNGATGGKGDTGATGASATSYWITASNNIIGKSQTGVINPTTITFKGFSKTGTANSVAYSGRFIIQTSTNGTTYTTRYTSNTNQSSYTYTIPADSLFVKCLFYMAGGTTVLLDEQTVPIVESAEGIQVDGFNHLVDSEKEWSTTGISSNSAYGIYRTELDDMYSALVGNPVSISYEVYLTNSVESTASVRIYGANGTPKYNLASLIIRNVPTNTWTRVSGVTSVSQTSGTGSSKIEFYGENNPNTTKITVRKIMFESATKPSATWRPNPQDARTYKAWANSADGGEDFTRVYPNENLFVYKDINNLAVSTNVVSQPHYKGYSLPVKEGEKYTIYRTQDTNARWGVYWTREEPTVGTEVITAFRDDTQPVNTPKIVTVPSEANWMFIYLSNNDTTGETIQGIKIEVGSEATIYTTNPQDSLSGSIPKYIGFSPLDSDVPHEYEWIMNPEYAQALADEALAGKVDNDAEYENLKNIAQEVKESYEKFVGKDGEYKTEHSKLLERTTAVETDLGEYREQINFVDTYMSAGNEGLIIGMKDSEGKPDANAMQMLLSNKSLSFMDGGEVVAYFSGQSFHINRGAIVDSLQIGQHKITNLGNGHTVFQFTG